MKRYTTILGLVLVLMLAGCRCTAHRAYLHQVRENLVDDIRPKFERALRDSGRPADLMANDLQLVDDTVTSIDTALGAIGDEPGGDE